MSTATVPAPLIATRPFRPWGPWCVLLADAAALELSLFLGWLVRMLLLDWWPVAIGPRQYQGMALGILLVVLAYHLMGLYPGYGMGPVERLRGRVWATLIVFSLLIGWDYLVQDRQWSRGILLATLGFALVLPPLAESSVRQILRQLGHDGMPVAILGAGATGALVIRSLRREPSIGLVPVAAFDDDPSKRTSPLEGVPVLGPLSAARLLNGQVRTAILAMPSLDRGRLARLVNGLHFPQVILIPDLPGLQSLWTVSRDLGGVLGLELKRNLLLASNRRLKQALDAVLGLPLFLLSLPLIAVGALWIKWRSPGPAFFSQLREGEDGRTIRIWKLRTMHVDAERVLEDRLASHPEERRLWETHYKLERDPRVIPGVGRLLRRFSLDELPQLWSVLKGEMSLVGPRPFPYYHLESFSTEFRSLRRSVPPGLTGLWQVSDRSAGSLEVQESCDSYYIRNWSPWLDLYVLARTVRAVLLPRGAY